MATARKAARQGTRSALQGAAEESQGQELPAGLSGPRPGDGQAHPHALEPEHVRRPVPPRLDDGYGRADTRPPHLTAARSHLDVPANPMPQMPPTQGLWGTGAIAALEALESALQARSRAQAEAVPTLRLPPVVGSFKADVLAWLSREGL